jgi:hypothetical protein
MLDGFVDNAQNDKFLRNLHIAQSFPFSITMPIINGKRFFEYVDYYILQHEKLFDLNKEDSIKAVFPKFVEFYEKYCFYNKYWRSGDEKVRNLYDNVLLAFVDKFGYIEDFENYYQAFYKEVYIIRCKQKRISLETILNSDAKQLFREINDAVSPDNLKKYQYKSYDLSKESVQGIDIVKTFISGFDFDVELKNQLKENDLTIEENDEYPKYYLIPFQFLNSTLYIFIGDKKNPYWYGFEKDKYKKELGENFDKLQECVQKLNLQQLNNDWLGWNEIKISKKEDVKKMVKEIAGWISQINSPNN